MQAQGQRGIIEIDFANTGQFMFHAHQSEFAELGWMGFFDVKDEWRGAEAGRAGRSWRLWAFVPLILLTAVVALFTASGSSITDLLGENPPPADEFDIRRVEFQPGEIRIRVTNPQPDDLTIASVTVDDAIMPFDVDGDRTLGRLRSSEIVVQYDWVPDEPIAVGVTSSTGIETTKEIAAAVETPRGLGAELLRLRADRHARRDRAGRARAALAALAAPRGARVARRVHGADRRAATFLAVEALSEALELQAALPSALGGAGLVLLGVALSFLFLTAISTRLGDGGGSSVGGLALATLVAIGIGLHNLGEGLAIGSSFALGELALGTFFIVGFMIHNVTEGLGIASPLAEGRACRAPARGACARRRRARDPRRLARRLRDERLLGVVFFAAAAGAAFEVVVEVGALRGPAGSRWADSPHVLGGFLAGIVVMYVTAGAQAGE